jgi:uncharacterized membrane protein
LAPAGVLLGVAMLGAGYLAWVALSNGPLAGCGPGSGCNKVLQSRWAYWISLPVSVPAALVYLTLLAGTILARKPNAPDQERGLWAAMIPLSVVVAGAAFWFVGLQVFVIKAFCRFCMIAHACGFTAAILCLKNIPLAADPATPMWSTGSDKRGVPRKAVLLLVLAGLAGVAVLAGGQVLVQKERNVVAVLPAGGIQLARSGAAPLPGRATNSTLAASGGQSSIQRLSPDAQLIAPRLLSLYANQFLIRLDDVPLVGSPDAPHIIVYLFDYTCPHCRELHGFLATAQRQFSNELAIVSLPMPMSTNCNPFIPGQFPSSSNSCDYARLGLAVWLAKPKAQCQFNDWFFAQENLVSVEQAREYAARLVGTAQLEAALANPRLQEQITTDCRLHHANWQATGRPVMPQLVLGQAVSVGQLNSVEHLLALLNLYLGMDTGLNPVVSPPPANSPQPK